MSLPVVVFVVVGDDDDDDDALEVVVGFEAAVVLAFSAVLAVSAVLAPDHFGIFKVLDVVVADVVVVSVLS